MFFHGNRLTCPFAHFGEIHRGAKDLGANNIGVNPGQDLPEDLKPTIPMARPPSRLSTCELFSSMMLMMEISGSWFLVPGTPRQWYLLYVLYGAIAIGRLL